MWIQLLKTLELCATLRATKAEWRMRLGKDLAGASGDLLKITDGEAEALPCSHQPGCGGFHEVRPLSGGRMLAVSSDTERPCSSFEVRRCDLAVFRFDLEKYLREIADTLTLDAHIDRIGLTLAALGSITKRRVPVFLSYASRPQRHRENLAAIRARNPDDFIFFVSHICTELSAVEGEVKIAGGRPSVLAGLLELDRQGRLTASCELTDLWPDLALEPKRRVEPLQVPDGTCWADIVFHLTDRETLKVTTRAGGDHKTYTRDALGMNNQRTASSEPKDAWALLLLIASRHPNGFPQPRGEKDRTTAANRVREINELLSDLVSPSPTPRPIRKSRKTGDDGYRWDCSLRADF